jgi:ATP adenylyltransferase
MKTLWAPWRMAFIEASHKPAVTGQIKKTKAICVFCAAQSGKTSVKNLVVYRGTAAYVIMNKFPYSNGHLLVIPNRHLSDYGKLTADEHAEMGLLLSLSREVLTQVLKAEGFNIGMNLGGLAGAGIREHLHYHMVPRWAGDHNFMPIFAEAKCLPEHLEATYTKVKRAFDKF